MCQAFLFYVPLLLQTKLGLWVSPAQSKIYFKIIFHRWYVNSEGFHAGVEQNPSFELLNFPVKPAFCSTWTASRDSGHSPAAMSCRQMGRTTSGGSHALPEDRADHSNTITMKASQQAWNQRSQWHGLANGVWSLPHPDHFHTASSHVSALGRCGSVGHSFSLTKEKPWLHPPERPHQL